MNSAAQLVLSSSRSDNITPLLHQLHWLKAPERIQFKLAVFTDCCRPISMERHRRIWPMNSSNPRISGSEPAYDRRWPHQCLPAIQGCRLSAFELFLSPMPAPGTICCATSRSHHLCLFKPSENAPRPAFYSVTFVQCLRSDSCHYWLCNRF